ncbi:hypothetical protein RFI_19688, partial [Reticulomyxa filosa]
MIHCVGEYLHGYEHLVVSAVNKQWFQWFEKHKTKTIKRCVLEWKGRIQTPNYADDIMSMFCMHENLFYQLSKHEQLYFLYSFIHYPDVVQHSHLSPEVELITDIETLSICKNATPDKSKKKELVRLIANCLRYSSMSHPIDWLFVEDNHLNDLEFYYILDYGLRCRLQTSSLQMISFAYNNNITDKFIPLLFEIIPIQCPRLEWLRLAISFKTSSLIIIAPPNCTSSILTKTKRFLPKASPCCP